MALTPAPAPSPGGSGSTDLLTSPGPFEGPEKLLEVWFAPSPEALPADAENGHASSSSSSSSSAGGSGSRSRQGKGYKGLRKVPRAVWEEMLDIVKCKVLSVVEGDELDAYLLSESSLFVAPHLLILKTCGTTLNLLGLHRIIEIAREYCGLRTVWRCFYSRKSFFFPERQQGVHKDWRDEVNFLDNVFGSTGSAYTVGPMNRDHWLLYLTSPNAQPLLPSDAALSSSFHLSLPTPGTPPLAADTGYFDTTLEILMTHLAPQARAPFFQPECIDGDEQSGHQLGRNISSELGIDALFPAHETQLDSFGFDPCGYSANAVVGSGSPHGSTSKQSGGANGGGGGGGGYFTIHVTPEEGWSYASFECNVPLPTATTTTTHTSPSKSGRPTLPVLIKNVVSIFQPSRLSITLFVSTSSPSESAAGGPDQNWTAFTKDLLRLDGYDRKDRIGYEFDGYDLVFACFEKQGWVEHSAAVAAESRQEEGARLMDKLSLENGSNGT